MRRTDSNTLPNGYNAPRTPWLRTLGLLLPLACIVAASAAEKTPAPETVAAQLRDAALAGHDIAYNWVSELTTRFGPRPAGSASEQQAAEWAAARL
jgi:carboxypeptidase Q